MCMFAFLNVGRINGPCGYISHFIYLHYLHYIYLHYLQYLTIFIYKSFGLLCCDYLGAASIPYIQDAILNLSNPYLKEAIMQKNFYFSR